MGTAWRRQGDMFNLPELKAIGEKHGKGVAQVILRWHIQRNVAFQNVRDKFLLVQRCRKVIELFTIMLYNLLIIMKYRVQGMIL